MLWPSILYVNGVGFRSWPLRIQLGGYSSVAHHHSFRWIWDYCFSFFFLNHSSKNQPLENCKKFIIEAPCVMFGGHISCFLSPAPGLYPPLKTSRTVFLKLQVSTHHYWVRSSISFKWQNKTEKFKYKTFVSVLCVWAGSLCETYLLLWFRVKKKKV